MTHLSQMSSTKPSAPLSHSANRRLWMAVGVIAALMLVPALAVKADWSLATADVKTLGLEVFALIDTTSRSGVFFLVMGAGLLWFYCGLLKEVLALASLASGEKSEANYYQGVQLYRNGSKLRNTAAIWGLTATMALCVIALVAAPAKADLLAPAVALGTCLLAAALLISPLMNFLIPTELRYQLAHAGNQAWLDRVLATFKETPWARSRLKRSRYVLSTYQFPLPYLYALGENANMMHELARETGMPLNAASTLRGDA